MMRVLYISYDGVLEPLGQSQVLAYLRQLAPTACIHLLSFEKPADWRDHARLDRSARSIAEAGIHWHPLRYHKRPTVLATGFDMLVGILLGLWLVLRHDLRIVHARSYVPGTIALALKRLTGARFLFDMRGFWADERVDGGLWARGSRLYRCAKWMERRLLLGADHVVSLTRTAADDIAAFDYLRSRAPRLSVIPTCTDLLHFQAPARAQAGFVLGYVGSAGTWYLLDEAIACFLCLRERRPDARLLVVNRGEHALISERLRCFGVPADAVELKSASHAQMPLEMARMHAAVFMIKPVFSKRASAPTKLGELLACGVPCLGNAGVGDMESLLEGERVGVLLRSFDAGARMEAVDRLLELCAEAGLHQRCVATAHRYFALDHGVASYGAIYAGLGRPA